MFRTMTPWGARAARPMGQFEFELPAWVDRMLAPDDAWWATKDGFIPRTDVIETAGRYDVTVELPGLKPEDVQVEFQEGHLVIHGTKKEEKEKQDQTFHRVERRYGEFRRVLPMPGPVDEGMVTAQFKDGVLIVAVPKAEAAIARKIEVKG
jgi:HSP20 family protein